jgi:hypothetical protein
VKLLLVLVALAITEQARVLAISAGIRDRRPCLTVLTAGEPGEVSVWREGEELIVILGATAKADLRLPSLVPPLEAVRVERGTDSVTLRIQVSSAIPYEVLRGKGSVTVFFGAAAEEEPAEAETAPGTTTTSGAASATSDIAQLYQKILPVPEQEAGGQVAGFGELATPKPAEEIPEGWGLGNLRIRPSFAATYVDAETALLTPQPVRDHYYQLQPSVGADLPFSTGRITASYEARIRKASAFEQLRETSHLLDVGAEVPLGPSLMFLASEHHSRGLLETNEVDPGGEYFFRLGRFRRNLVAASLRLESGGRIDVETSGSINSVNVAEGAGFFDYQVRSVGGSMGYHVGANLRAVLGYSYEQVPAPDDRPLAVSTAHTIGATLTGEVLPLIEGDLRLSYREQKSPRAAPGGTRFRGLAGAMRLRKDFTRAARVAVAAGRSTPLSNFENNAFYVASSTDIEVTLPLPLELSAHGGAGYHWNDYRTVAAALGAPRKDRIFGWSAGLGRPVTRWGYLRADYRSDRRDSNLDAFDIRTKTITVQFGVGFFGSSERSR